MNSDEIIVTIRPTRTQSGQITAWSVSFRRKDKYGRETWDNQPSYSVPNEPYSIHAAVRIGVDFLLEKGGFTGQEEAP